MFELIEADLESFFEVPSRVYSPNSAYVSPMKSDLRRFLSSSHNPLFQGGAPFVYYTLLKDGAPFGRIVAHVHRASNDRHGWKRCSFGYFDCGDDREAACRLLEAAEAFGREQGCEEIVGNFNLTAMQQLGVMTEGFSGQPYTDMQFNPAQIPQLLAANGYAAFFPMSTFETNLDEFDPESLLGEKQRALLDSTTLRWRTLKRRRFEEQMNVVRVVLNDGFADNPMFVPVSEAEFLFQAKEMMWIVDERISSLVFEDDSPVGVIVCIPDLNPFLRSTASRLKFSTPYHFLRHRLRQRRAVIIFYSVSRRWHGRGLASAMLYKVTHALKCAGYERLGTTWIAEENPASLRQMEKLAARPLHRLRLFRKDLEGVD